MEQGIHNYYLSQMRKGLIAQVKDEVKGDKLRPSIEVAVSYEYENTDGSKHQPNKAIGKDVQLYGPGEILGFNENIIVKTEPNNGVTNFRADLIPYIEFADPDFLWRYSIKKDVSKKNWIPWLTLIVLEPIVEFKYDTKHNPELPPVIFLKKDAKLPDLNESWRWCHIHINDKAELKLDTLQRTLKQESEKAVCRMMCPRRLKTNTKYVAFVVPTYELGVQAAFGEPLVAPAEHLAWTETTISTDDFALPFYHSYEFETGEKGDFETLVKKLKGHKLEGVGKRKIDCTNPGYGLKNDSRIPVEMEGALMSEDIKYQDWVMDNSEWATFNIESYDPDANKQHDDFSKVIPTLRGLLNSSEDGDILRVVPPIYGKWYDENYEGADANLQLNNKGWLEELNYDFRHRAAAGLGVQFIKDHQEDLMENAWNQLKEVKKANRAANLGRFGVAVSDCLEKKVLGKKINASKTSNARSAKKTVTTAKTIMGGQHRLRMVLEPKESTSQNSKAATEKINYHLTQLKTQKYLRRFRPLSTPPMVINKPEQAFKEVIGFEPFHIKGLVEKKQSNQPLPFIKLDTKTLNQAVGEVEPLLNASTGIRGRFRSRVEKFRNRTEKQKSKFYKRTEKSKVNYRSVGGNESDEDDVLKDLIWYPEFHTPMYLYLRDKVQGFLAPGLETVPNNTISFLTTNNRFIESFMIGLNHEFASELRWREFPTDMRGSYFRKFWDTTVYSVEIDELGEFISTPFADNLFQRIERYDASLIRSKTIGEIVYHIFNEILDKTGELTQAEKFMAMTYEEEIEKWLLTRDEDKDIHHPVIWNKNSRLGKHGQSIPQDNIPNDSGATQQVVMVIRGELLHAFPNALVYLAHKKGDNTPDYDRKEFPVFEGKLPPDVLFLGFDITKDVASDYYAVFEEPLDEVKYGLDELVTPSVPSSDDTWQNVSWQHFSGLNEGDYLNEIAPLNVNDERELRKLNDEGELEVEGSWDDSTFVAKVFTQHSVRLIINLEDVLNQMNESNEN